ncbi:MAG: aldo/keto reductase [Anaerolineales bacterium]|nr:aldo/keto reductase [Anaerolineales bacterium]
MLTEPLLNGHTIPKIGFGTWNIGGGMSPDYSRDARGVAALRAALETGYTHFDTAEMYANGHTEELIARTIRETHTPRERLFLTSKVWTNNLHEKDTVKACENSLRRLQTDYLDLYLIHWPGSVPLEDTFRGLNALTRHGLVRAVGVSNFDLKLLHRAQTLSETPIVNNQVPYSLHHREYAQNGVLAYCQENGITITAYTPVEKGRVANDTALQTIARKHNASPTQIALAWLIQQPCVIAIPMSHNPAHIAENFRAGEVRLSEEEMKRLNGNA